MPSDFNLLFSCLRFFSKIFNIVFSISTYLILCCKKGKLLSEHRKLHKYILLYYFKQAKNIYINL